MRNIAKSLSARAEFCLVVFVAFGLSMLGSVLSVFNSSAEPEVTNGSLRSLVVFELVVLSLLAPLLYVRGWRTSRLGSSLKLSDFAVGLGLTVLTISAWRLIALIASLVDPGVLPSGPLNIISADLTIATVAAVSMVNPIFEEIILCGYVVTVLKERRGFWTAINVSMTIRLICHLYQGSTGVLGIIPFGFILTYWYARTGRLWPVILAHALADIIGLWSYVSS